MRCSGEKERRRLPRPNNNTCRKGNDALERRRCWPSTELGRLSPELQGNETTAVVQARDRRHRRRYVGNREEARKAPLHSQQSQRIRSRQCPIPGPQRAAPRQGPPACACTGRKGAPGPAQGPAPHPRESGCSSEQPHAEAHPPAPLVIAGGGATETGARPARHPAPKGAAPRRQTSPPHDKRHRDAIADRDATGLVQSTSRATCRTRCRPRWVREGGVRNPVGVGRSCHREEAACTEEADAAHEPPPAALPLATGPPPRERAKGSSNSRNFRSGPKEGGSGTGRCGSGDRRSGEPRR
ncbi:hypothetical protein PVAP13_7KG093709 [Panicum virgatum]|uniref:Uncharacterized protein n=1 Tax=Panicum virgatum TaxID=38727 RepID=A0A8T0QIX9_PANVG|nr:hypothetical protein PVAP13_7KG093709 [Panicum virgatum]